jgi:hypothetical protein
MYRISRSNRSLTGRQDMMGVDALRIAAHRGNIGRYKGLLRTHLTEFERAFVYRRLEEEKCALASLIRKRRVRPFASTHGSTIAPAGSHCASRCKVSGAPEVPQAPQHRPG